MSTRMAVPAIVSVNAGATGAVTCAGGGLAAGGALEAQVRCVMEETITPVTAKCLRTRF